MRQLRCSSFLAAAAGLIAGAALLAAPANLAWIEIEGSPASRPSPLAWLEGPDAQPTLRDLVAAIDKAARSDRHAGLVLRLREPELTATQVQELGAALMRYRATGKKVHMFTEIYGPSETTLASYVDEALMQEGGALSLPGLYMEEMFLADTLAWAGAKADFVQIGDYKGAAEALTNTAPSPQWDENISGLLDGLFGAMRTQIQEGRGLSAEQLDKAMKEAWWANGDRAVELGLIDAEIDRLALDAHLEATYGEFEADPDIVQAGGDGLDMSNPFMLLETLMAPPDRTPTRSTIALLHIDGAIIDGESTPGGLMGGASVGSLTIRQALAEIEDSPLIKGVVIRIDSPGGSAIASESIWQGVRRVAETRPVWVSVGSMAASGGYYIAVAGDKIYVNPSSIVGSIGVVGGKVAMGGVYDRLKVHVTPRARGPMAEMMSSLSAWSPEQRELVRLRMQETYDLFTERVSAGRPGIDLARTAEGRLFEGERAIDLKMADEIGGLDETIRGLASAINLKDGAFDVMDYPAPKTLQEMLEEAMGQFGFGAAAPNVSGVDALAATARELFGPRAWPAVRDAIGAVMQLREEPVILVSPRVLIFR